MKHVTPSSKTPIIQIERMTSDEYGDGGRNLSIRYKMLSTLFGDIFIASTSKGICQLAYVINNKQEAIDHLRTSYPNADIQSGEDPLYEHVLAILNGDRNRSSVINLHVQGTDFQLNVWQALLSIPFGELTTYKNIAIKSGHPNAHRAAGTAIGENPIAFFIPCHRVIQSSGALGSYHWGSERKAAIIEWEKANK